MSTTNIKDIAQLAGVGIATVSRALNDSGPVNPETKKRILQIASEYHYIPNTNAQNLKSTQSKNIALLVKGLSNPFFADMIKEIQRFVNLRKHFLIIQQVDDSTDEISAALQLIKEKNLCGIIFMGGIFSHMEAEIQMLNIPCVLTTITLDGAINSNIFSSVVIDDIKEAYKATSYLISLGHRRIAYLAKSLHVPKTTGNMRLIGYQKALEDNQIPYDISIVSDCEYTPSSSFDATKRLIHRDRSITAFFAASDTIAIGCAKAILSENKSIPEDFSIMGFDGIEMAEYYHPSLDTISQPGIEMALSSINLLFGLIDKTNEDQHIVYDAVLVKRGSCSFPRK